MSALSAVLIGFSLWVVLAWFVRDDLDVAGFFIGLLLFCFLSWLFLGPETETGRAQRLSTEARERAERTPHVIREADGCKVYAFKANGRDHYFTRCGGQPVPTLTSHSESCGKNCTRTFTEEIK